MKIIEVRTIAIVKGEKVNYMEFEVKFQEG